MNLYSRIKWFFKKSTPLNLYDNNTDNTYYKQYSVAHNIKVAVSDSDYHIEVRGLNNKHTFSINIIDKVFYLNKLIKTHNENKFYIANDAELSEDLSRNINNLLNNNLIKNNIKYVYYANATVVYVENWSDVNFILNNLQLLTIDQNIPTTPQYSLEDIPQELHVLYKYFKLFVENNDNDRPKLTKKDKQIFINTMLPLMPLINHYLDTFQLADKPLSVEAQILGNMAEYFSEIHQ